MEFTEEESFRIIAVSHQEHKPVIVVSARRGDLAVVKFFMELGHYLHSSLICEAAWRGDLAMIKMLRENGCDWYLQTMNAAAGGSGNLELVKWLTATNCPRGVNVISIAARNGHFEIVKWLAKNGWTWTKEELSSIRRNQPEIGAWLKSQ